MAAHCFAYALGGLVLMLGQAIFESPYPTEGIASAARALTRCLLAGCLASYIAVQLGLALVGRELRVPSLMWGAASVAVVTPLVTLLPFPVVSLCIASLGLGLWAARVHLGRAAAFSGGLEMMAGVVGAVSGPSLPALALIPALVYKVRALEHVALSTQIVALSKQIVAPDPNGHPPRLHSNPATPHIRVPESGRTGGRSQV